MNRSRLLCTVPDGGVDAKHRGDGRADWFRTLVSLDISKLYGVIKKASARCALRQSSPGNPTQ